MKILLTILLSAALLSVLGMFYWMYKSKNGTLVLSKKSWHFKLKHWMWDIYYKDVKNACPYYWGLVFSILVLPLYLIAVSIYKLYLFIWDKLPKFKVKKLNIKSPIHIPQSKKEAYTIIYKKSKNWLKFIFGLSLILIGWLGIIYAFWNIFIISYVTFIILLSFFTYIGLIILQTNLKPEWDKYLSDAVNAKQWPSSIQKPCKKLDVKDCVMQLISIMAKYESNFKPETNYTEGFNDSKGKPVISRGLLQISQESANQRAYNCQIKDAKQLNDTKTNLECAVNIIHFQAVKHNSLMGEPKKGCSAYWSVCRVSSKSNAKILSYLSQF
jgi:hypothetical protein